MGNRVLTEGHFDYAAPGSTTAGSLNLIAQGEEGIPLHTNTDVIQSNVYPKEYLVIIDGSIEARFDNRNQEEIYLIENHAETIMLDSEGTQ